MFRLRILDILLIALAVVLMQLIFDYAKVKFTTIEIKELRDTIHIIHNTTDTTRLIEFVPVPVKTIYRDSFINNIVIPGTTDTIYIIDTTFMEPDESINIYQDSLINKMMRLKYTAATYGRLLFWTPDELEVYPEIKEKHIVYRPFLTLQAMAGIHIGDITGPAVGAQINIHNYGIGLLTSSIGSTYFLSYKIQI